MGLFILKRFAEFVPTLFVIVTVTFFLVRLAPGGPFDSEKRVSPEVLAQIEAHYNMDRPLLRQYADYLGGLLRLDFGPSFRKPSRTVREWLFMRLPISIELGLYGLAFALALGLGAGIIASLRHNSLLDHGTMGLAMLGICVPAFVLGPLLVLVFGLWTDWLPVMGWTTPAHKILPSITLGAAYAAYIARMTRGGMLETLSQDFIRTARAKGLRESRVVLRHGLRSGIQPVVAFLGPAAAGLLTGSFVVETIFHIPGLGREFVESAFNRDYTMISGAVLVYAVLVMGLNLVSDLALAWLDPRIRAR
ncbi:MAG: ABC transporter permease [Candidatus Hydrogenedentes bacterium]|jgi:oligopeptide transport system permease protein|nr:ABC transporter permease [Candidatus Hydrogenedentota bacterium]